MIYSLTGKVTVQDENTVIVDTGVMAFEVICSSFTSFALSGKSEPQTILTYLDVREDGMTLFGFSSKKEKVLFNHLIAKEVSGVGPKTAISILSGLSVDDLVKAIVNSDIKALTSIKGLGKKTAEIIVLKLNNKFGGTGSLDDIISSDGAEKLTKIAVKKEIEETYEVLISMGVQKATAIEHAKNNYKDGMTSEELVVVCLKNMHK